MGKRNAIKAALCIIAAVASTSAVAGQYLPNADDRPSGDVWLSRGEPGEAPLRATAPEAPDNFDPPPGGVFPPAVKIDREGMTPPSEIKFDIILTMRRPHKSGRRHRAVRSCR
jgi:hypothetical protein